MKNYVHKILFFCSLISIAMSNHCTAQDIELENPSFEGVPKASNLPGGWRDCGTPGYTSPDTQPDTTFKVTQRPQQGNTYLGMVTRADESYECVAQHLSSPMLAGECYEFSLYLARSDSYLSGTLQNKNEKQQHTEAIKLRILGANSIRGDSTILDETTVIKHTNWRQYHFKLKPNVDFKYIKFQAYYVTPTLFPYIGNVLVDNCSTIKWVSCDEEARHLTQVRKKTPKKRKTPKPISNKKPKPVDNKVVVKKVNAKPKPKQNVEPTLPKTQPIEPAIVEVKDPILEPMEDAKITPKKPEPMEDAKITPKKPEPPKTEVPFSIAELDKNSIQEGQTIRIDRINFSKKSAEFADSSIIALNQVYDFLRRNSEIVVEIGGHTNQLASYSYSMDLSQKRAASVVRYLIEKGINKTRISARGYGRELPLDESGSKAAHATNQRVEIKIISIGE